ncbi:hypothetical protein Lalb_Chr02g0153231 [Lupinus albus]|uniref:Uncharacterized protein n=1 Tax=Lupinus albus TaxID=3870 RepID=A0A6A4R0L9_LUPAL|nr:hypothetical protein Lalb_Chr02g0153231 [Lupinus albus]
MAAATFAQVEEGSSGTAMMASLPHNTTTKPFSSPRFLFSDERRNRWFEVETTWTPYGSSMEPLPFTPAAARKSEIS